MFTTMRRLILVAALVGAPILPVVADDSPGCKQMDQILAELQHLRALIESDRTVQAKPPTARIDVGTAPFLGFEGAPLAVVEFTDFQCPYCRRFYEQSFPDLKKDYIDTGKIRFYSMDLPLDIHQNALGAAQAGRCANEQGRFWAMHDRMQSNPNQLDTADLTRDAQDLGMDAAKFKECLDSGKYKDAIEQAVRYASSHGVTGTPAFVIGRSTAGNVEGELVIGAQPYDVFDRKLKALTP